MGLAGFEEGEDGHEEGEGGEEAVADYRGDGQRLGGGEAAAIDLHACGVGVDHGTEETENQQRAQGDPHAQLPAEDEEQTQRDFREGQGVGHEIHAPGREQLIGANLQGEEGQRDTDWRTRVHDGQKNFGVSGVDEETRDDQPAEPDHRAAEVEGAGLHHFLAFRCQLSVHKSRISARILDVNISARIEGDCDQGLPSWGAAMLRPYKCSRWATFGRRADRGNCAGSRSS